MDWLVHPSSWSTFLDQTWEQRPAHIQRSDPTYFAELMRLGDLDQLLEYGSLTPPRIRIALRGDSVHPDEYVRQDGSLDLHSVRRLYASGQSLILNGLEHVSPSVGRLVQAMVRELSYRVEANAYLTPAGEQAFKPHYDTHEVLVLQLHGSKHWLLYGAPYPYPLPTTTPSDGVDVSGQDPSMSVKLRPGDCLYVPRGWIHEAASSAETSSLHLTLGIHPPTWSDLISSAIQIEALRRPELRRSLPVGFLRDQPAPDFAAELGRLLSTIGGPAVAAEAAASLHDQYLGAVRHPSPGTMIQDLDGIVNIDIHTKVVRRHDSAARLIHFPDAVAIQFGTAVVRGPQHYATAMHFVLTSDSAFSLSDLPGLDDDQRLALARQLMTEGLLDPAHRDTV